MGTLEALEDATRITLHDELTIGRAKLCSLVLDNRRVSSQHAMMRYRDGRWWLRDLGSKNGTSVDDVTLEPGKPMALSAGAVLSLGGEQQWRLLDDGPPVPTARHVERTSLLRAPDGFLGLPDPEAPEATVYCDEGGEWVLEHGDVVRRVNDQECLALSDGTWELWLPKRGDTVGSTAGGAGVPRILRLLTLRFRVSLDEEYVELHVDDGKESHDLGARSHHYVLLTLARRRLADLESADVSVEERGWVYSDELGKMLGYEPEHLNILVYRARKQLTADGVENGGEVVQRRPSTRQLRLGTERVFIETL
jgi:FHA domain